MRLLVCVPWFVPARAYGGIVTAAAATAKGAVEAGHEVTVATTDVFNHDERLPRDAPTVPEGARVVRFRNVSHRLAAANVPLPLGLRGWLRGHMQEFDVVLLQDVYSAVSVLGARTARRAGVPYVLQAHGTLPATRERGRATAKRGFQALWGRRTVREAAMCLYLSEREREEYFAQGADPARLLPMPPPLDLPPPDGVPRAKQPTVVYLGQLHPIKRIDVLLDAFARVRRELREARLEVLGAPSRYGNELQSRAGEGVTFHGLVSEDEKVQGTSLSARVRAAFGERGPADHRPGGARLRNTGSDLSRLRFASG